MRGALRVQAAAAWILAGMAWYVQLVHYPLFARLGPEELAGYARANLRRTALLVGPVMLVEAAAALALAWRRPEGVGRGAVAWGLALLGTAWLSTGLLQLPAHLALAGSGDAALVGRLLATNWLRAAAWTARGFLVLSMVASAALPPGAEGSRR